MDAKEFALKQPKFATFFERALAEKRVSQAYLLYGSPRCDFLEVGRFMAKSLGCQSGGLADGTCRECRRFDEGTHPDFTEIDGMGTSIKKDQIAQIKTFFGMTSVENGNRRGVYLISACENFTEESANALLKFLEEPTRQITAILTTQNLQAVLPTIISRCETFRLTPIPRKTIFDDLSKDQSPEIAYFLSDYSGDKERLDALAKDPNFQSVAALANDAILSLPQGKKAAAYQLMAIANSGIKGTQCYNWFYGDVSRFLGDCLAKDAPFGPYADAMASFGPSHAALVAKMQLFLSQAVSMSSANLSFTGVLAQLAEMLLEN